MKKTRSGETSKATATSGKFKHCHDNSQLNRELRKIFKKYDRRMKVILKDPVLRQQQMMLDKIMNARLEAQGYGK